MLCSSESDATQEANAPKMIYAIAKLSKVALQMGTGAGGEMP